MLVRDDEMATTTRGRVTLYRSAPMTLRRLGLATLLFMTILVRAASAAPDQASVMMDDDQLLYRNGVTQTRTLVTMRSLGADAVKATVLWRVVAEGADLSNAEIEHLKGSKARAKARAQRKRFKAGDPRTYPTRNWDRYDNLVKEATKLGMRVYFTVTGPGPRYGHRVAPPSQRANAGTYMPIPNRFRSFVQAVGRRYSGTYKDENGIRQPLPRVALWSIWNEPNQPGWLSPQWTGDVPDLALAVPRALPGRPRGPRPQRPRRRRDPHRRDRAAGLRQEGPAQRHQAGAVPARARLPQARRHALRRSRRGGPPLRRLREEGPAAGRRLRPPPVHEEGRADGRAEVARRDHDGQHRRAGPGPGHAVGAVGRPHARGRCRCSSRSSATNRTRPTRATASRCRSRRSSTSSADFLAYNDPRILATTQFLVRDVGPVKKYPKGSRLYWFTYQSGLYTVGGRAKPAAFAYTFPFLTYAAGPASRASGAS